MYFFWVTILALLGVLFLLAHRLYRTRGYVARLGSRLASVLAVDSIGLSVWNTEGRLVACNTRFRDFYPGVQVKPGWELEDMVRFAVTRGLIQAPDKEIESLIEKLLTNARNVSRDVVRTAAGRWLEICVRPTENGEFVMLYTDITDAHELGMALTQNRETLEKRAVDMDLICRAVEIARATTSFESATQQIVNLVCNWSGWPIGHAYRVVKDEGLLPIVETQTIEVDAFAALKMAWIRERLQKGEGLVGRVLVSDRVVWVANIASDPTFSSDRRTQMPGIRGACGVPVRNGGRVVAVLEFLSREQLIPASSSTRLLEVVAETLGLAFGCTAKKVDNF
jgi:hypothetical protein